MFANKCSIFDAGTVNTMAVTLHSKHDLPIKDRDLWQLLRCLLPAALLSILIPANTAIAEDSTQSQSSIREAVKSFITQGIEKEYPHHEILVSRLDPRLKLAACQEPLTGFLPMGAKLIGNTTIGIRCTGSNPWTIYVPTAVKAMREVIVATRPILRSTAISKADIRLEERNITGGSAQYIFKPEHVLGKLAKRDVSTSTALTAGMLSAPLLIRRGQQVIILADGPGLEVRMAGTALMDGTEGQVIRAKNKLSKRTVEGRVIKPGIIRVNM